MHLELGISIAKVEAHVLALGLALQIIACLMNSSNFHKLQISIGLLGVVLMIIGFHRLPD